MATPFSFEEASQPVNQPEQAQNQPVGFSFEEAMQPPPQQGFSFEQAFAPVGAEPEEPFVEKTQNPFMGMIGRVAGLAGSGIEAVAEVGERAGDWLETNLPISGLSKEEVAQQKQLQPLFNWAKSLKDYERNVGYAPTTKLKDLGENPLTTVPFIAERVITSAPDMAAAVLNLPAYVGARTKEILDERVKNDNKTLDDATVGDVTSAAAAAVIEGTLERFATRRLGLGEAPAGTSKAGRITREGGVQAGTEATEETAAYAGEALGTEKGFDTMTALERAAEGAIVGGGLGATAQGVKEALPKRETEEDKLITELRGLEPEPTAEEDIGEVVQPEVRDERAEPRVRQPEPRVDTGAVEPSVSVPIRGDETAAGVAQPVAERVVDDSGLPSGVTERAAEGDVALEQGAFTFEEATQPEVTTPAPTERILEARRAAAGEFNQVNPPQSLIDLAKQVNEADAKASYPAAKTAATKLGRRLNRELESFAGEVLGRTPTDEEIGKLNSRLSQFIDPEFTTPSVTFDFNTLIPQDDPKSVEKFAELKQGKKKAYAQYTPLVNDLETTAGQLASFIQERGFDPNNLAELRSAPTEVQDAIKLLNALGADARNMGQSVRNQERQYASSKTEDARLAAKEKAAVANSRLTESVKGTISTAQNFLQNPTAGTGDIVFSDTRQATPGGKGTDAKLVRQLASRVMTEWENAPRTKVVQSIAELPDYMQEQIKRDNVNPQGAYDPRSNQVFLISDNLRSADDVFMTVAHEALGHFGLRSILGDSYTRVMNEIYNGHKDVKAKADAKQKANSKMTREIAVEEVLAEMAETAPKPTPALRRLFDAIRRFARRIGMKLTGVTDGELQQLVANASRYVRRGKLKYDPFTKGVVQEGGPKAVIGDKAVYDVVKRDARLSDKRIKDLYSTWAYVGEDADTKAYLGFVRPQEFLEATTTPRELAYMREREFTPLDREKIAGEIQPIFLQIGQESKEYGAPLDARGTIIGHEGRHRMMALQKAGVEEVPVVFINGYSGQRVRDAKPIKRADFDGQSWGDVGQGQGFTAYDLIPISYEYRNQIKETFGGEADVVFSAAPPAVAALDSVYSQGFKSEAGPNRVNPAQNPNTEKMSQGRPEWNNVKGKFNLKAITGMAPTARQVLYKTLTLRMLKDIAGKRLPQLGRAIDVTEKMVAMRTAIQRDGADILDKVQALAKTKKGRDQIRLMGEIQVQATMLETDPDPQSKFYKPNATLEKAWKALGPEAQGIYREMRGFYEVQIDGMVNDMMERVDRNLADDPLAAAELKKSIIEEFGPKNRKGPYFPLRRFGNHWFQVGKGDNKEFYMFESANDRDYWMAERVKELQAGGNQDAIDEMSSGDQLRGDSMSSSPALKPIMDKIEAMVDASALELADPNKSAQAVAEIKDSLKQLQYTLLPGTNLRKMFIHRKGVQGASTDAVRAFSTSVVNLAYQRARTKYSELFYQNVDNGFAMLQNEPNTQETRVLRDMMIELDSRTDHILGIEPTTPAEKISNGLTQFSFLYLLTAPASALVNVFGMTAVGLPYAGAAYGYPQVAAKSLGYLQKYIATAPKFRDGNTVFPTLDKATSLTDVQRRAYDRFLHDNAIDVSLTQDIMGLSQAPFEKYSFARNKVVRGLSALFHHSERLNREVLNMTVFDLAYDKKTKAGMDPELAFEEAVQEAKDISMMSLGDFTRTSKPPILTGPVTRIVFQFKQYSLLMTYNLLRNTMVGFNPFAKNLTAEQKAEAKEARRRMYGVVGVTALYAGLKGMPIFTATSFMAETLNSIFGDDEDDWDFEYWLQGYLQDTVGGTAAASIMRGVIAQGTNASLSERMGLDLVDLWFRDSGFQRSAEDSAKEFALANLGPTFSIMMNFAKAKDLHDNYNGERALETMLPTVMRNLATVRRYLKDGEAQTTRGITIDDDISYSDLFVKALGFTPEDIMQKQKATIARKGAQDKINLRRERLLAGMYMALHTDDEDVNEAVLEKIMEFNDKYPEVAITSDTIQQSLSRKLKDKAKQETLGGVEPKLAGRLEERFRSLSE